jgi:iron-sulfur cluster assembly accessory protein
MNRMARTTVGALLHRSIRHGVRPAPSYIDAANHRLHASVRTVTVEVTQHTSSSSSSDSLAAPTISTVQKTDTNTATSFKYTYENLIITDSCWKRIQKLKSEKNDPNMYLRVFVDAGGCSGFTYVFELDQADLEAEDKVFEGPDGARVVVDDATLELIKGSKIDYVQEMIKSSFEVRENPQSESACGCGSSFAVKNFTANPAMD